MNMFGRVFIAGILGLLVLLTWIALSNGIFGFYSRLAMMEVEEEAKIHGLLNGYIPDPGVYVINPEPVEGAFPTTEPVYEIRYSGIGHGDAGRMLVIQLVLVFLASVLAAGMFMHNRQGSQASYLKRVSFFLLLGAYTAIAADLGQAGIGKYTLRTALLFGGQTLLGWALVGLVLAAWLRPDKSLS